MYAELLRRRSLDHGVGRTEAVKGNGWSEIKAEGSGTHLVRGEHERASGGEDLRVCGPGGRV